MRIPQSKFLQGINRRFDVSNQDDPGRVYKLENARLQKRGETGQVSRVQGYETLNGTVSFGDVHDLLMFDDKVVVLWHSAGNARVHIIDMTGTVVNSFTFSATNMGYGKLILLEDTIFISPYNRQLNFIGGQWYLNGFKSTTGLLKTNQNGLEGPGGPGDVATGSITIKEDAPAGEKASCQMVLTSEVGGASESFTIQVFLQGPGTSDVSLNITVDTGEDASQIANKLVSAQVAAGTGVSYTIETSGGSDVIQLTFLSKEAGNRDDQSILLTTNNTSEFNQTFGVTIDTNEEFLLGGTDPAYLKFSIGADENIFEYTAGDSEPKNDVAAGVSAALNLAIAFTSTVNTTGIHPVIEIDAPGTGEEYNKSIVVLENSANLDLSTSGMSGGTDDTAFTPGAGHLEFETGYWYSVRLVYQDGHKTTTCFPQFIQTKVARSVRLLISTPVNLDGTDISVEIYRRKEAEEFFMIDRITVNTQSDFEYVDSGRSKIRALASRNYVWSESNVTGAIVRDRLVKAGLTYMDRDVEILATVGTANTDEVFSIIPGIQMSVYARARFEDGLLSPHKLLDEVVVEEEGKRWSINQTAMPTDSKEVGYYATFERPAIRETDTIKFPTLEIYNANIPSIETAEEFEGDQDRPVEHHVFAGFGQIHIRAVTGSEPSAFFRVETVMYNEGWGDWGSRVIETVNYTQTQYEALTFEQMFPAYVEKEIIEGHPVLYKRISTKNLYGGNLSELENSAVYEIAWLEGLKEYIITRDFQLNVDSLRSSHTLSTTRSIGDFQRQSAQVIGYEYQAEGGNNLFEVASTWVRPAASNRVYMLLNSESIFQDYNSTGFNNQGITDFATPDREFRAIFNLLNITYEKDETPTSQLLTREGETYYSWEYEDRVLESVPDINLENSAVFIGSTSATGVKTHMSGFEQVERNHFAYYRLPDHSIIDTLITPEELEQFSSDYPTQLIWSEPQVLGTGISGIREFLYTNFKTISQNYGPIIDIRYIRNHLLVFCERGVNMVNIGETLTQQAGGEVVVSSERFLTTDTWILKNVPGIQLRSIVEHENSLFFCDGQDAWIYSGEQALTSENNISNGAVEFDGDIQSAGIDPKHKEYRITDQSQTWAYSIEMGEWMGPYTYIDKGSTAYRDRMFAVAGSNLVEHNKGNTYGGASYLSFVESVAMDMENRVTDKLWRKLFIDLDGTIPEPITGETLEFLYGKGYSDKIVKNIFTFEKINGLYHIGVNPDHQNSTRIFWGLRTDIEDFVLRGIGYKFTERRRQ